MNNDNKILSELSLYFSSLAKSIENKTASEEELKEAFEFYIKQDYRKKTINNNSDETTLMKFLTMGWFVYTQLLMIE